MTETYISHSIDETLSIAESFAQTLTPGTVVSLAGELGAGKTVFARGICKAFGIQSEVTSPTFTLIHEHNGKHMVYHMDFYRLENPADILEIGVEDLFYSDAICLVEWASNMGTLFPEDATIVRIEHAGDGQRAISIERPEES